MKICIICGDRVAVKRRNGITCRECQRTASVSTRRKAHNLYSWYSLTLPEYNALLEAQKHRCALCGGTFGTCASRAPAVDHDHVTNIIRGVVHQDCNRGLGLFDDNPILLDMAANYLRTARTQHSAATGKWARYLKQQGPYRRSRKSG